MRSLLFVSLTAAAVLICSSVRADWQNSLLPKGEPAREVGIVSNGKALGSILLRRGATTREKRAAEELQRWMADMTGTTVGITVGKSAQTKIEIRTDTSLGDEGYAIAVEDGRIILSGGVKRGLMNAVFALLEEDLGCRFYTNDSIRLPKSDSLAISAVPRRYVPRLMIRDPYYACAFDPDWSMRNRTNCPEAKVPESCGGHMDYGGMFVHTAAQMLPPDKYLKDHPDWFGLQPDGSRSPVVLCATNPEVAKTATAYVRGVLEKHPTTEIVSVSKNDVPLICHCDRCKKLREAEGSDMANQLVLVNSVAESIEKRFPKVTIDTLAYLETIKVPKSIRPRKNVSIRLCNDDAGSWLRPFTPAEQCETAKLIRAWSAVHKPLYIWDYNVNFSHYLAPMPNIDVMAANVRFWVENHAAGVMLQGGYEGPAERDELKSWVMAKLLWDPSRDEKALTQDFLLGHYGKAAEPMVKYEALLEGMRQTHAAAMAVPSGGIRYPMDAPFITEEFVTSATQLFAQAKQLAAGDDQLTQRVERAELPIHYVKCVRGPGFAGGDYAKTVADFERIARRLKIKHLKEQSGDFEEKLAAFKKQVAEKPQGH